MQENSLANIVNKAGVTCFGGGDWWYHNRGHVDMQLMRLFARMGKTLYINSIVMQKPRLGQGIRFIQKVMRKAKSVLRGLKKIDAGFWVYSPFSLPVYHTSWLRSANRIILLWQLRLVQHKVGMRDPIVWVVCPTACEIAMKIKKHHLVYLRTDRYEEYPNVDIQTIKRCDQKLKTNADLTIFVSRVLYDEESGRCKKAIYVDHGVDFENFASAEQNPWIPSDIASIKKPIIGFFGGIDEHTSDISFIEKVTDLLPEMSFVLVGKTSANCLSLLPKKNVWMLGQKPYEQIPHYGKCFDVAIMPWRQNRWIEACNPVKLKEYLALGKPIVSTPFAELRKYRDVLYEAKTPKEFADCIKKAHSENSPELVAKRRQKVAKASWESKAELVLHKLFNDQ